jgi:hypothetical protein
MECQVLEPNEIQVAALDEIHHDAPQPMIRSLHIENFRCYSRLHIEDLGLINIIVGDNGGGKTALMEALFLPGGGPELIFRLRQYRGQAQLPVSYSKTAYEMFWKDLFHKFSQNLSIQIELKGSSENHRTLRIFYNSQASMPLFPQRGGGVQNLKGDTNAIIPLAFETKLGNGDLFLRQLALTPDGSFIPMGSTAPPSAVAFLPATFIISPEEIAKQFSELRKSSKDEHVCRVIHSVFPQINDLSPEVEGNNFTMHCTRPGMKEKIPVSLVSNGIQKVIAICMSIASQSKGMVLVDEIDNGIYFKSMPEVWRAVLEMCKTHESQLFVSTHSLECLQCLLPLVSQNPNHFRLLRAVESKDGGHAVNIFSGKDFASALEMGGEVR